MYHLQTLPHSSFMLPLYTVEQCTDNTDKSNEQVNTFATRKHKHHSMYPKCNVNWVLPQTALQFSQLLQGVASCDVSYRIRRRGDFGAYRMQTKMDNMGISRCGFLRRFLIQWSQVGTFPN